jgi:IrrE N-terminal-like domain
MTQIQVPTRMNDLYDRLMSIGLSKEFLRESVLPDWWCDEYEQEADATVTAAAYFAKLLNLNFKSLLDDNLQPQFTLINPPKFKTRQGIDVGQLSPAVAIAAKVAAIVAYGCKLPYHPIADLTVAGIRQEILSSRQSVDLAGFLDFCWSRGLPVVHFSRFPVGLRRFQGMAACFDQRPVIILSLDAASPSRLLFIAAHEFGHILQGHLNLTAEDILVDERIELESQEAEAIAANEVAVELVGGHLSAAMGGAAMGALNILEPDAAAAQQINRYLLNNLDWDKLGVDYAEYLESVLGLKSDREMR